jgi:hypothetical protein
MAKVEKITKAMEATHVSGIGHPVLVGTGTGIGKTGKCIIPNINSCVEAVREVFMVLPGEPCVRWLGFDPWFPNSLDAGKEFETQLYAKIATCREFSTNGLGVKCYFDFEAKAVKVTVMKSGVDVADIVAVAPRPVVAVAPRPVVAKSVCKFGLHCTRDGCWFEHPEGHDIREAKARALLKAGRV